MQFFTEANTAYSISSLTTQTSYPSQTVGQARDRHTKLDIVDSL